MTTIRTRFTWLVQNRLALFAVLLAIEALFFVTNGLNSILREPTDGWELAIQPYDDQIVPNGYWLIPYFIGFAFAALIPLWAAYQMPIKLYRQFVFAMASAALVSYALYMLFPTYVTKPTPEMVPGNDLFAEILRNSYKLDAAASTHNAAPSQHVFYALIIMAFMIRFRPKPGVFGVWVLLGALISASTVLTQRHNLPDLITGYMMAVAAYYVGVRLGERVTQRLGDADKAYPMSIGRIGRRVRRLRTARTNPLP